MLSITLKHHFKWDVTANSAIENHRYSVMISGTILANPDGSDMMFNTKDEAYKAILECLFDAVEIKYE